MKEKKRIQLQIAKIHNNIGCAHFEIGEIHEAREAFERTFDLQNEIHDDQKNTTAQAKLAMSSTICNLGTWENEEGNHNPFFMLTLVANSAMKIHLGFLHLEAAEWEIAIARLKQALEVS